MASISYDSELMTNYIEAVNVPAASHMSIVQHSTNREPVVFALSSHTTPKLQAIYINKEGRRVLVDIGEALGLPADTHIQAFDVQQNSGLTVFLAFAAKVDDRTSKLWIVTPFKFKDDIKWKALPSKEVGQIYQIRIGPPPAEDTDFPQLYLMHQPLNRTAKGSDLARVVVKDNSSFIVHKDVSLPVNVREILDVAPAHGGVFGPGLIFLSDNGGKREIHAKFGRPGDEPGDPLKWAEYKLQCPPGASSIETFVDPRDGLARSSLMVACTQGIYLLGAENIAARDQGPGFMLATDQALSGARNLQIAQEGLNLSVWVINELGELAMSTFVLDKPKEVRTAPLLPSDSTTAFATLLSKPNKDGSLQNIIVANDDHGNLTLLEQSLDTGIWRQQPFYVEGAGVLNPIESYTVSLNVYESAKTPLIQGQVLLQSPSPQSITVNGRIVSLDSVGRWIKTDLAGEVALILPTNGVTAQPLTITKLRRSSGEDVPLTAFRIDPGQKIIEGMKNLASKEALSNAKTSNGKSLWEGVEKPDEKTLEQAAKCFAAIGDAHATLPKDGSVVKVKEVAASTDEPTSTGNPFMDAFNWVKRKIQQAKDWIVKKVGQVWQFVCDIGGKVMKFVLDCVEKVREAASWVWEKIKLGWQKLVDFVGFFFNWQDILETKNTIKGLMNAGLDFAADGVEGFNDKIEGFFDGLIATIPGLTGDAKKRLEASKLNKVTSAQDKKTEEARNSTQSKWVGERMKNGGTNTVAEVPKSGDAEVVNMWYGRVVPLVDSFKQLAEDLGRDIAKLFKESSMSQADMLNQLGSNLLINVLNIVKNLIKALISVVAKLILVIKDFGNAKLSSGFLNTLYRWITRGSDLSLFDAVALLIAIPSTQIIKLVTGAKPPNLGTIDKNLFKAMISSKDPKSSTSGGQTVSKQQIKDVNTILLGCACGGALIKMVVNNIKFLYKTATQGLPVAVGSLSPGAVMEVFAMGVDAFAIYDAIMNPPEAGAPGAELIKAATYVKCFRLGANAIYMIAQKLGMENQAVDQAMLCVDLLTALANFGMYSAVYIDQLEKTSWKDYDEDQTLANGADNFLEAIAAIGYFTAFTFNKTEPTTTAIGLACLQVASYGAIVTKGVNFRLEYVKS